MRYELIVEANGYTSINGLASITIANGGYGWSIGSTFSIGTGGAVGVVSTLSTPTGSSFIITIDAIGGSGDITTSSIVTAGTGYTVGEYFSLLGGATLAIGIVLAINGSGGITSYGILTGGSGYTLNDASYGQPIASVTSAAVTIIGAGYVIGTTYTTSGVGFLLTVIGATLNYNSSAYLDTENEIDSSVSLNYNIADISDISSKNSGYSKTITLPDTKNNREVFQYIFGINSDSTFDAGKKSRVWVVKDSVTQFEGYLQMTNIIYDNNTNKNYYEVIIYDDGNGLFVNIGESYLSDLSLSQYNHLYGATAISASWTKDYTNGYYYPLIDYAYPLDYDIVNGGGIGSSTQSLQITNFAPATYLKVIVDQIFVEAGYSYTSNFFNSDFYKQLVVPFCNKTLTPYLPNLVVNSTNQLFLAHSSTTQSWYGSDTTSFPTDFFWGNMFANVADYNPNGFYNTATHSYTNTYTNPIIQRFGVDIDIAFNSAGASTGSPWLSATDTIIVSLKRSLDTSGAPVAGWGDMPNLSQVQPGGWPAVTFGGIDYIIIADASGYLAPGISFTHSSYTYPYMWKVSGTIYSDYLTTNPIRIGEQVRFFFERSTGASGYTNTFVGVTPLNHIFSEVSTTIVVPGYSKIDIPSSLPANVKQKDLMSSIMKMFNLYFVPDKYNPINLIIEPRDYYYSKYQVVKNWSKKLDLMMPINSQIASNTQKKTNLFTYKQDKDIYNSSYETNTNKVYGEYKYEINNDFINDINTIEPIFSPTIIDKLIGSTEIYLPSIANLNNGNYVRPDGMNIRLLYKKPQTLTTDTFYFSGHTYSYYPYAGPCDNPLTPTVSLNFGQVSSFYAGFTDTVNNLFYNYWQNAMTELSNKNSRIITAYFNLNAVDISQFNFSDLIFFTLNGIDGYYRVNKIVDYNPSLNQTTKIELIKADNFGINPATSSAAYIPELSPPITIATNYKPMVGNISLSTTNTISDSTGVVVAGKSNKVYGSNNIISGTNNLVTGTNNYITGDNHNVTGDNVFITGVGANVTSNDHFIIGAKPGYNVTGSVSTTHILTDVIYQQKKVGIYYNKVDEGFIQYTDVGSVIPGLTIFAGSSILPVTAYVVKTIMTDTDLKTKEVSFTCDNTGLSASGISRWELDLAQFNQPYTSIGAYTVNIKTNGYLSNPTPIDTMFSVDSEWGVFCLSTGTINIFNNFYNQSNNGGLSINASTYGLFNTTGLVLKSISSLGPGSTTVTLSQRVVITYKAQV